MADTENAIPPSKKRVAGRELTRDTPVDDDDDECTPEVEVGTFKRASDEVLASRRIVKVRRQQTDSAPSSNPFAGIRLVAPTESNANPAEATAGTHVAGAGDASKDSDVKIEDSEKPKDKEDKQPEGETHETEDKSAANKDAAEESSADKEHIAEEKNDDQKPDLNDDRIRDGKKSESADTEEDTADKEDANDADKENANANDADKENANANDADKENANANDADKENAIANDADKENANANDADKENANANDADKENANANDADKENANANDADKENANANDADKENANANHADKENVNANDSDKEQQKGDHDAENDDTKDGKVEGEELSTEGGTFKSFQQLSSSQNAFTGIAGTGFTTSLSSFGPNAGPVFGSGSGPVFGQKNDKPFGMGLFNNGSFSFGASGSSLIPKSEGSGLALQEVPVETGEENEKVVFNADSVLFEFADGSWKERGKGELKVNVNSGTEKARILMRARGNYRLILNARLYPDMKFTNMEKKGVSFACINSATEGKHGLSTFALKFKDRSIVEEFKSAIMEHKGDASTNTSENSPKASV